MGSAGIVRGSGRGRAFSCGIERACGCPRCLICTEASGFSHFRPNCTHRQGPPPVRGPAAALPGTRWWVAVTVRCDISSTIFPTIRVCVMYEEGIGYVILRLICVYLHACIYSMFIWTRERIEESGNIASLVAIGNRNRIHLVSLLYSLECVIEVEFLAENRSSLFRCPL